MSRRTMLAPIRPRPIMPTCIRASSRCPEPRSSSDPSRPSERVPSRSHDVLGREAEARPQGLHAAVAREGVHVVVEEGEPGAIEALAQPACGDGHPGRRMAGVRLLDGVHGERADGVDAQPVGPVLPEGEVTGTGRGHTGSSTLLSAEGAPCRMNATGAERVPVTRCSPFASVVAIPSAPSGPVYLTGHARAA